MRNSHEQPDLRLAFARGDGNSSHRLEDLFDTLPLFFHVCRNELDCHYFRLEGWWRKESGRQFL